MGKFKRFLTFGLIASVMAASAACNSQTTTEQTETTKGEGVKTEAPVSQGSSQESTGEKTAVSGQSHDRTYDYQECPRR